MQMRRTSDNGIEKLSHSANGAAHASQNIWDETSSDAGWSLNRSAGLNHSFLSAQGHPALRETIIRWATFD